MLRFSSTMDNRFSPKPTPPNMALRKPWIPDGPGGSSTPKHSAVSPVHPAGTARNGESHHILRRSVKNLPAFITLFWTKFLTACWSRNLISCAANRLMCYFVDHPNSPIKLTPVVSNNLECHHHQPSVKLNSSRIFFSVLEAIRFLTTGS